MSEIELINTRNSTELSPNIILHKFEPITADYYIPHIILASNDFIGLTVSCYFIYMMYSGIELNHPIFSLLFQDIIVCGIVGGVGSLGLMLFPNNPCLELWPIR